MLALLFRRNPGSTDARSSFSLPYHFSMTHQPFIPGAQLVITISSEQTTNVENSCTCASPDANGQKITRQDAKEGRKDSSVAATVPLGQAPKSASERFAELSANPVVKLNRHWFWLGVRSFFLLSVLA